MFSKTIFKTSQNILEIWLKNTTPHPKTDRQTFKAPPRRIFVISSTNFDCGSTFPPRDWDSLSTQQRSDTGHMSVDGTALLLCLFCAPLDQPINTREPPNYPRGRPRLPRFRRKTNTANRGQGSPNDDDRQPAEVTSYSLSGDHLMILVIISTFI